MAGLYRLPTKVVGTGIGHRIKNTNVRIRVLATWAASIAIPAFLAPDHGCTGHSRTQRDAEGSDANPKAGRSKLPYEVLGSASGAA